MTGRDLFYAFIGGLFGIAIMGHTTGTLFVADAKAAKPTPYVSMPPLRYPAGYEYRFEKAYDIKDEDRLKLYNDLDQLGWVLVAEGRFRSTFIRRKRTR